jgi:uncharacterized protein
MSWQVHTGADDELRRFLRNNEWRHVGFSARIVHPDSSAQTIYINRNETRSGAISEAILFTSNGLLVPVLSLDRTGPRDDIQRLLYGSSAPKTTELPLRFRRLHSVMGFRGHVEAIQEILRARPYAFLDYHSMTLTEHPPRRACDHNVVCKVAKPRDSRLLFSLQKAYEMEEVLLDPSRFNPHSCMLSLQRNLRKELVVYALKHGEAVAKAGTNAQGLEFVQLGGVYTVKELRNRGVGELVLGELLERIIASGKSASLFVKKNNPAAIRLYKKLKFRTQGEFRIAYYR